jgi:HEAT repeat protein
MMPRITKAILMVIVIVLTTMLASAENDGQTKKLTGASDEATTLRNRSLREPSYQGKPLSYWLEIIRDRDEDGMPLAFDAIRYLGPGAQSAVPALIEIVTAPFSPIRLGRDSDELILAKLCEIELRSEAIDTLAAIGEGASSATISLLDWAVTVRVIPARIRNADTDERFIDLVTMDVEKRIQIIVAIAEFGEAAVPTLVRILKSPDAEKRKLAVAILGEEALTVTSDLLRSRDCEDVRPGITILNDMEPVVARAYLTELRNMLVCYAN